MSNGRPPGLTEESKKLRAEVVELRDVEKKSFRQIGELVGIEFQQAHRLYHYQPSTESLQNEEIARNSAHGSRKS